MSTTSRSPDVLHAAFVRSPHPHALIARSAPTAARALPGVLRRAHARRHRAGDGQAPHGADLEFGHAARPLLGLRARRRRGVLCGRAGRARDRRRPLRRRGRRRAGRGDLRVLPAAADCRAAARAGAPAVRREIATNVVSSYRVGYGDVDAAFRSAPHVFRENFFIHRGGGAFHRRPRHPGRIPQVRRCADGVGLDPEGARPPQYTGRLARPRRQPPARGDARRRRRLRSQALRLRRGRGGRRRREAVAALGEMDRGPPRAFPQRGAGARPALVDGDRRRRRRPYSRAARQAAARSRRLCAAGREPALQFGFDADRSLCRARPSPWR